MCMCMYIDQDSAQQSHACGHQPHHRFKAEACESYPPGPQEDQPVSTSLQETKKFSELQ